MIKITIMMALLTAVILTALACVGMVLVIGVRIVRIVHAIAKDNLTANLAIAIAVAMGFNNVQKAMV